MANKKKHNERSKMSSHNYIPFDMFASHAKLKKYKKDNMKKIKEEKGSV